MTADLLELFDRLQPPEGWDEPTDLTTDDTAAAILARVLADDGSKVISLESARRRRRRATGGLIATTALVAGAVAATIINRQPETVERITCSSEAVAEPERVVILPWDSVTDPVELCGTEAVRADLARDADADLQACVSAGSVVVLPGTPGTCERLGFAVYEPTASDDPSSSVDQAAARIQEWVIAECRTVDEAEPLVRSTLDEFGLTDWTITIADAPRADETCATVRMDAATSVVTIDSAFRPD